MTTKVNVIYSIPSPYQEGLFENLSKLSKIELTVFYTNISNYDREWQVDIGEYKSQRMRSFPNNRNFSINPRVVMAVHKADVVVIAGYGSPTMQLGIITAKITKTPLILMTDNHLDDWNSNPPTKKTSVKSFLLPKLNNFCDAFFVPGKKQIEYLSHYGADPEKIFTHLYTCDVQYFNSQNINKKEIKSELGIKEDVILLYVGRISKKKGVKDLIYALKIVNQKFGNVGLVIAGAGEFESGLKSLIKQLGVESVYPVGFTPRTELPNLYGIADIFVFPSRGDPWGVVINEAMASGLPIITTDRVGASQDLVVDGVNGTIVPASNPVALSNAISSILAANKFEQMGTRSQQIVQYWTQDIGARSLKRAIDTAVQ